MKSKKVKILVITLELDCISGDCLGCRIPDIFLAAAAFLFGYHQYRRPESSGKSSGTMTTAYPTYLPRMKTTFSSPRDI